MAHAQVRPRGEGSAGDDGVTRVATAESAGLATHDRDTALSGTVVRRLSAEREEPAWMLRFRLRALDALEASSEPGASRLRSAIDAEDVVSDRVGVRPRPASPRGYSFADAVAESERAYRLVRDELESLGVLFMGMDEAVREHSGTLQELLGSVVPPEDDPSAALNGAVWSGGTFLYVPPGVRVQVPLQPEIRADFRKTEPFERSLLVAGPGSSVEFIDGCTAPVLTSAALHASVVEVIAREGASVKCITLQNWSRDVDNYVSKRAHVSAGAAVEWLEANLGARHNVKAPSVHLLGKGARAEILNVGFAGRGQHQEIGADVAHMASSTTSRVEARLVLQQGGRASYGPRLSASPGTVQVSSVSEWSALLLDATSACDVQPSLSFDGADANADHRGSVERLREDALFYLTSRGLSRKDATRLVVRGVFRPFTRRLPLEYAVEVDRLVELQLEGAIG